MKLDMAMARVAAMEHSLQGTSVPIKTEHDDFDDELKGIDV